MNEPVMTANDVRVTLTAHGLQSAPVDGVSLKVGRGESLGIVGESGSGKSLALRAILGLPPATADVGGTVRMHPEVDESTSRPPGRVARDGISMVFQEPMTALNPTMPVGDLIAEGVRASNGASSREAHRQAVRLLQQAGVPEPERRARMWPHELSGGLRQRVMIAAALSTEPALLLCDEPTTALDVSVQKEILSLLNHLRTERAMAVIFVSHDLAVVAEVCDRIAVMYAGQIIEQATVDQLLTAPQHPYTAALIASAPSLNDRAERLTGITGTPPDPSSFPDGCRFAPRCAYARDDCRTTPPRLLARPERLTACIHPDVLEDPHS